MAPSNLSRPRLPKQNARPSTDLYVESGTQRPADRLATSHPGSRRIVFYEAGVSSSRAPVRSRYSRSFLQTQSSITPGGSGRLQN